MPLKFPSLGDAGLLQTSEDELQAFIDNLLNENPDITADQIANLAKQQFPDAEQDIDRLVSSLALQKPAQPKQGGVPGLTATPIQPALKPTPVPMWTEVTPPLTEKIPPPATGVKPEVAPLPSTTKPTQKVTPVKDPWSQSYADWREEVGLPPEEPPVKPEIALIPYQRDEAWNIGDLATAQDYARYNGMAKPFSMDHFYRMVQAFVPPYEMTQEQRNILGARVRITEWNAEAAYWAGVPQNVIDKCIKAGGVNIAVAGWLPGQGWENGALEGFERNLATSTESPYKELREMGFSLDQLTPIIQADYQSRIQLGLIGEGGETLAELPSEVKQDEITGEWYRTSLDGKYKIPVVPSTMAELVKKVAQLTLPTNSTVDTDGNVVLESGAKITPDGGLITVDGTEYSPEQVAESQKLLSDLGKLFPDQDIQEMIQWADKNPIRFVIEFMKIGDSPLSRAAMQQMGMPDEYIDLVFSGNLFQEIPKVPLYMTPEGESLYDGKEVDAYLSTQKTAIEEMFGFEWNKPDWLKVFYAGMGDVLATAGGAARWMGKDGVGENLSKEASKLQLYAWDIPTEANWDVLFSPRFYAWRPSAATGWQILRALPFSLSLIPAAIAGTYGGAAVAGAVGLGALGSLILGSLGAAALSRPIESALEAGGAYDDAVSKGFTPEKAKEAADEVFRKNLTMVGVDAAEFAVAFAPMPYKVPAGLISKGLVTTARVGGKVIITGLSEGGEEVVQEVIQRQALGEPVEFDEEMKACMAIGGVMGIGLGVVGDVFTSIKTKTVENLSPEAKAKFDAQMEAFGEQGLTPEQAELKALDAIAETPEGKAAVEKAVADTKQEELLKQVVPKDEAEQLAWEQMFENFPKKEAAETGIPMMITKDMETRLRGLGFSSEDINNMTPQQAWENLGEELPEVAPKVGGIVPPTTAAPTRLPVGEGKVRESEHFRKMNEAVDGALGDNLLYQTVSRADQTEKALALNAEDLRKVALGLKKPPEGLLDLSASAVYERTLLEAGNIDELTRAVNSSSRRATAEGQNLSMLRGSVNEHSPTHFIKQVIAERANRAGDKLPALPKKTGAPDSPQARVARNIDKEVEQLTKAIKTKQADIAEAQKFIDSLDAAGDRLKTAFSSGELTIEGLFDMTSEARRAAFEKYSNLEIAKTLNAKFERAILSKQKDALQGWAKSILDKKRQKTILGKIDELDKMGALNPESEAGFLSDLVASRLGINVTPKEVGKITTMAQDLERLQGTMDTNLPSLQVTAYFNQFRNLEKYIQSLNPNPKLKVATGIIGRGNLLLSIPGPLVNIISNKVNMALRMLDRRVAIGKTRWTNPEKVRAYIKKSMDVYKESGMSLSRMDSYGARQMRLGEEMLHAQGPSRMHKVGQWYEDVVYKWMYGADDEFCATYAFGDRIDLMSSKIAQSEKLTGQAAKTRAGQIMDDAMSLTPTTPEGVLVRSEATADALRSTYTNDSRYANFVLGVRNKANQKTGNWRLGDMAVPFVKTVTNVVKLGVESAGAGFAEALVKLPRATQAFKLGDKAPMRAVISAAITSGAGLFFATLLANATDPEDFVGDYASLSQKERDRAKLLNAPFNSVRIGDKWVSLDFFGPLASAYVGMMQAKRDKARGESFPEQAFAYVRGVGTQAIRVPGMQEVGDLLAGLKRAVAQDDMFKTMGEMSNELITTIRGRVFPTGLGQFARAIDPYERVTGDEPWASVPANIPGLRQTLPIQTSQVTGEPLKGEGLIYFLFGSRVKTARDNAVITEINRLYEAGEAPTVRDIEKSSKRVQALKDQLSQDEWTEALMFFGKTYGDKVKQEIETPEYQLLSDEDKMGEINSLRTDAVNEMIVEYQNPDIPIIKVKAETPKKVKPEVPIPPENLTESYAKYNEIKGATLKKQYLEAHKDLYNWGVEVGVFEEINFEKVPPPVSPALQKQIDVYDKLPAGNTRLAYRKTHPDLDEWLLETGRVTKSANEVKTVGMPAPPK